MNRIKTEFKTASLPSESNQAELPKISIVVPNYNGGATLERTLQSLIDQNYPNLEIIVVDGNSSDDSVGIIQKFEHHITKWMSEKDSGQSNAINKGVAHCSGDIVNWLCSDDVLTSGTLQIVGKHFFSSPELDVLAGGTRHIFMYDGNREYIKQPTARGISLMPTHNVVAQPSCFYRRELLDRPQPIDESYDYAMDFELWSYFKQKTVKWKCIDRVLSTAFEDGQNKSATGGKKVTFELERIYNTYVQERIPLTFWHRRFRYPLERFLAHHPGKFWLYLIGSLWVFVTLLLAPFYGFQRVWIMRWKAWA